jgi:hypothetical protein
MAKIGSLAAIASSPERTAAFGCGRDPRNPGLATGLGPGLALLLLLVAGGIAVMGWNCPF